MIKTLKTIDKINVCIDYIKRFLKMLKVKNYNRYISGGKVSPF